MADAVRRELQQQLGGGWPGPGAAGERAEPEGDLQRVVRELNAALAEASSESVAAVGPELPQVSKFPPPLCLNFEWSARLLAGSMGAMFGRHCSRGRHPPHAVCNYYAL